MQYRLWKWLLGLILTVSTAALGETLHGKITNRADGKPIAFATIYAKEAAKGVISGIDGSFTIVIPKLHETHLRISCMGYQTLELLVKPGIEALDIKLNEQSFGLKDVTVTAKFHDKVGSDATIEQEALEYIQPMSLNDVFVLLPGGKIGSNNMQGSSLISSRQVGSDRSTSFGMGVTVNGVPVQNDGMRIQMTGITGHSAADGEGNVTVNTGVDLRTLSTDHIESVTLTRGISSAKEGNLSSGTIRVNAKQGVGPLQTRIKFDPLNKLAYIGKGFYLPKSLGTLYVGADIVRSQAQIEDERGAYNRISSQLNWNNQQYWWGKTVDMNVLGSYVTSFSNNKTDEIIRAYNEKYNSRYERTTVSGKLNITFNEPYIDNLELLVSADYTRNILKHHKHVINRTVMPLQQSLQEGESEGIYLPSTYDTYYKIDNRPLNIFVQFNAWKSGTIGKTVNYNLLLGTSLTTTKNKGDGIIVNPKRPPFPSEDFIRPRKNSDIPALVNHAGYVESKLRYRYGMNELTGTFGVRSAMMLNLPSGYKLDGRVMLEPRLQAAYTLYNKVGNNEMSHTFRGGYGIENKLPSADFLYPDKVYHDFIALNAYFTDASKRLLITNTKIQNPVNKHLSANRNTKVEVGYDLRWHGFELNLTGFREEMRGGIEYFTTYIPAHYIYYYELLHPVVSKPTKADFKSREMYTFISMQTPTNSARTVKQGLEYRLHIPTIMAVKSEVEINGAYYRTTYGSGVPVMYRPSIMIGDQMYPYVGIFDGSEKQIGSNFNTNIWVNTHLPKWKLIFTNFIQIVWFEREKLVTDVNVYPEHYMDTNGNIREFRLADDEQLKNLKRNYLSSRYKENKEPISLLWNLKATKEFNRHIKLSFFANNIVQVSPKYRNGYAQSQRNWRKPFFGAELSMSF